MSGHEYRLGSHIPLFQDNQMISALNAGIMQPVCGGLPGAGAGCHKDSIMNVDKAKKRIAKWVKKGDRGYPMVALEYFGKTTDCATEVVVTFILEEGAEPQEQKITSTADAREDESIQSVIVRIIERAEAATVTEAEGVSVTS